MITNDQMDQLLNDASALSDPAVLGNVMSGLLDTMNTNTEESKVDASKVIYSMTKIDVNDIVFLIVIFSFK